MSRHEKKVMEKNRRDKTSVSARGRAEKEDLARGVSAHDSQNRNIPRQLTNCEELRVNLALRDNYPSGWGPPVTLMTELYGTTGASFHWA